MRKILAVFFVCLLALPLAAQQRTGNLYGKVVDQDGVPLPGVNVTLTSPGGAPMVQQTNNEGVFRFLSLPPSAEYEVKCELEGFKTRIEQRVIINVGRNSNVTITMELGAIEEEVTVVATTPTVTPKRTEVSHTMNREQLMSLPSARDPWVIIQMVPGMLMDRENIGGAESGQQSSFVAKGETTDTWVMDGINITDLSSISSPTYFDFDVFEEISVTTGMPDVENRERAMIVNMVTRRGQNKFGFGGRFYLTDEAFQMEPSGDSYDSVKEIFSEDNGYPTWAGYNSIKDIKDFGFNMGGPLVQDKVWWWMSYGVQLIETFVITGDPDNTQLNNYAGKLNFQLIPDNRAEIFLHLGDKKKQGRDSTTSNPPGRNQHGKYHFGSPIFKLQDEHMFGDDLFISARYGFTDAGFGLWPGNDEDMTLARWYDYDSAVYRDPWNRYSYASYFFSGRPHQFGLLQAIYYNDNLLGASHEIKVGAELNNNQRTWVGGNPGNFYFYYNYITTQVDADNDGKRDIPTNFIRMQVGNNDLFWEDGTDRTAFYIQDIITAGRITFNLQMRLDREKDYYKEATTRSLYLEDVEGDWHDYYYELMNEYFSPEAQQAIAAMATDRQLPEEVTPDDYMWWTFSPRVGITYDLFGDGKTILKGAFAIYPGSPPGVGTFARSGGYPWYRFWWSDQVSTSDGWVDLDGNPISGNGDYIIQLNELYWAVYRGQRPLYRAFDDNGNFVWGAPDGPNKDMWDREKGLMWGGFDTSNPTGLVESYTTVDPDWKVSLDWDFLFEVQREIFKDFGVGAAFTFRRNSRSHWSQAYYPSDVFTAASGFSDPGHIRSKDDYVVAGVVPDYIIPDTPGEGPTEGAPISTQDGAGTNWYYRANTDTNSYTDYSWSTMRPDSHSEYWGVDFTWNKRYSNKWMLSGSFTYQWQGYFYGDSYNDPTGLWAFDGKMTYDYMGSSSGKISVPMFTRWMFKLQGMYSLPLGFDISFALSGREGMTIDEYFNIYDYNLPNNISNAGQSNSIEMKANGDEPRLSDVWVLNMKLQKRLMVGDLGSVWLSVDAFNALNSQPLNRERSGYFGAYYISYTPARYSPERRYREPNESINPLTFRVGIRFQF